MISLFIVITLGVVLYSLWVRRDTWWSRWEAAATFAIAMEGCALVLLSPWAGDELGPRLHNALGVWNVQQLFGNLFLIVAVLANIYHMLVRLADPDQVPPIMRQHLQIPLGLTVAAMVVTYAMSARGFEPDTFAGLSGDSWMTAYEVTVCVLVVLLSGYVSRLMLALRNDPRARTTINLYLASMVFAVGACAVAVATIWSNSYAGPAIWACICLSVGIFAYGLAKSWQAKQAWFSPDPMAQR